MAIHHIAYPLAITEYMTAAELAQVERRALACKYHPSQQLSPLNNAISWRVLKFSKSDPNLRTSFLHLWAASGQNSLDSSIAMNWLSRGGLMNRFNTWDRVDIKRAWAALNALGPTATPQDVLDKKIDADRTANRAAYVAENQRRTVLLDPGNRLMWTAKDAGRTMNFFDALRYCRDLSLDGHSDWLLPTLEELKSLYDPTIKPTDEDGLLHVRGNLRYYSDAGYWGRANGDFQEGRFYFEHGELQFGSSSDVQGRTWCVRQSQTE